MSEEQVVEAPKQEVPDVLEKPQAGPPITRVIQDASGKVIEKSHPEDISFQMTPEQEKEALNAIANSRTTTEKKSKTVVAPVKTEKRELLQRYLMAVCRLGSGRFEGLSEAELIDIARCVIIPVPVFEEWKAVSNANE